MTLTNEQLDKARAEEAKRRVKDDHLSDGDTWDIYFHYRKLVVEDWTPAPKVDPLLLEAREICAAAYPSIDEYYIAGNYDDSKTVHTIVTALRRGMELARTEGEPSCEQDAPGESKSEAVYDDAAKVWADVDLADIHSGSSAAIKVIRTALAAAEKRGIERSINYANEAGWWALAERMSQDLLGSD